MNKILILFLIIISYSKVLTQNNSYFIFKEETKATVLVIEKEAINLTKPKPKFGHGHSWISEYDYPNFNDYQLEKLLFRRTTSLSKLKTSYFFDENSNIIKYH